MHHRSSGSCNRITRAVRDTGTTKGDRIGREKTEPSPARLHTRSVQDPQRQRDGTERTVLGMAKDRYRCQAKGSRLRSESGLEFSLCGQPWITFNGKILFSSSRVPPPPLFCLFRMLPTRSRFSLLTPLCSLLVLKFQSPLQQKWRSGAGEQNHGGVFCIFPRHASGTSIIYLGLINFIRPLIHLSGPHEVCEIILTGHSVGCNRIGVRVQG